MVETIADELQTVVNAATPELRMIDASVASTKTAPDVWSIKEILGHLVDSAANNHQRFVRAHEVETLTFPSYDQDKWVKVQDYQHCSWLDLIEFWRLYNLQLVRVIRQMPASKLSMECKLGSNSPETLAKVIEHYLVHLKHHLQQNA
jgi:hypothetical protein